MLVNISPAYHQYPWPSSSSFSFVLLVSVQRSVGGEFSSQFPLRSESRREKMKGLAHSLLPMCSPYRFDEGLHETEKEMLAAWTHKVKCRTALASTTEVGKTYTPGNENHKLTSSLAKIIIIVMQISFPVVKFPRYIYSPFFFFF